MRLTVGVHSQLGVPPDISATSGTDPSTVSPLETLGPYSEFKRLVHFRHTTRVCTQVPEVPESRLKLEPRSSSPRSHISASKALLTFDLAVENMARSPSRRRSAARGPTSRIRRPQTRANKVRAHARARFPRRPEPAPRTVARRGGPPVTPHSALGAARAKSPGRRLMASAALPPAAAF